MKFRWDKKYLYWGITAFCVVVASALFYYLLFQMPSWLALVSKVISILNPIIYGAAIAYFLNPLVKFFEKYTYKFLKKVKVQVKKRVKTWIRLFTVILSLALALLAIYGLLALLIPEVINSIVNIAENFTRYANNVETWFMERFSDNETWKPEFLEVMNTVSGYLQNWLTNDLLPRLEELVKSLSSGVFGFLKILYNFLIGLIISIYILVSKENFAGKLKRMLYSFSSIGFANAVIHNLRFVDVKFGGFIIGKIIDSAIIGVLCYIGTSILNMPYALLVSVIVGITNVIPFFGPFLGAIPCAILIFVVSPIKAVYFAIFILGLQQLDGNFIGPKVLGESTGMSSFMVIVAIMIGSGLMGVLGMFVAVPVCSVLIAFGQLIMEKRIRAKNLPEDLEVYKNMESIDPKTREIVPLKDRKNMKAKLFEKESKEFKDSSSEKKE